MLVTPMLIIYLSMIYRHLKKGLTANKIVFLNYFIFLSTGGITLSFDNFLKDNFFSDLESFQSEN